MKAKVILIAAIVVGAGILHSQDLPPSARHALNQRFSHWSFRPSHIPNPCDIPGEPRPSFKPVSKCNLNGDGIPDYLVAITKGRDSNIVEYFIALVSSSDSYSLFLLDSAKINQGAGERNVEVMPSGLPLNFFGGDEEISNYGRVKKGGEVGEDQIAFPTDAIEIYPECEAHWKEAPMFASIFIKGRFVSFMVSD